MSASTHRSISSRGGFKELTLLFFPILLMTFSTCLTLFVEKLLFAHVSSEVMKAAVSAVYACQVFQAPCVALAMMAQVYVGRWYGAQEVRAIGAGVWQFIWFSCLSMVVVVPLSWLYGAFYFKGTSIADIGLPYFHGLIAVSFLFPLGTSLSCFFLGQGKTRLVLGATLVFQSIKFITAYLLIFGWKEWIPSYGLMGGILSTLMAQGGFCLFLFWRFLHPTHVTIFHTHVWRFQPRLFWNCIYPGLLRAANRILNFTSWASISQLMTLKEGEHLLILSIGGTLFIFLPFLGESICQAQITIVSQILGAKEYMLLNKAFRSGTMAVLIISLIIGIPLVACPSTTFHLLFPDIVLSEAVIYKVFLGVWISFVFFAFGFLPISYVLAFKDTKFSLFMGGMSWINGFLFMYVAIVYLQMGADQFWLVLSLTHFTTALLYLWRMRWLLSRQLTVELV